MSAWLWVAVLLITNLATGVAVALRTHQFHQHSFDPWSPWILNIENPVWSEVDAVRYHVCRQCNHVERQITGSHRCVIVRKGDDCPHLDHLNTDRIAGLEKELGLDG